MGMVRANIQGAGQTPSGGSLFTAAFSEALIVTGSPQLIPPHRRRMQARCPRRRIRHRGAAVAYAVQSTAQPHSGLPRGNMKTEDVEYALGPATFRSMREAQESANALGESLDARGRGAPNARPELVEMFSKMVNNAAEHGMTL